MSRTLAKPSSTTSKSKPTIASTSAPSPTQNDTDTCPVCKSTRYMNPSMTFLLNPACYHKMCSSCVDRYFSSGPAQCPIARCTKTLRKQRFRKITFADLRVEREIDVRKRVAEVFNRREDEFESLRDWNDYLEEVENITFELIEGINVNENERKLQKYKEENARSIKTNAQREKDESADFRIREKTEKEQARMRREAARREEEEEMREVEQGRMRTIEEMAKGKAGDAHKIAKEGEMKLKQSKLRRTQPKDESRTNGASDDAFVIRGLKKRRSPSAYERERNVPYDPFGGIRFTHKYFVPKDQYEFDWLNKARVEEVYSAGGYDVDVYCQRALVEAFEGLGVFIGQEIATRDGKPPNGQIAEVATEAAADIAHYDRTSQPKGLKRAHREIEDDDF